LKQYLRFFTKHKQSNWLEWLATVEFVVNNKVHIATQILPFMANYERELRMGVNIRRKRKVKKTTEFVERIKKVQKEAKMVLRRMQEEIKKQVDRRKREVEEWKKRSKVMSSSKDLVFKERPVKKLTE